MKIACIITSKSKKINILLEKIKKQYKLYPPENADYLVCLGGDGFMLHTIHNYLHLNKPIYGINCGTVGFLMNDYNVNLDIAEKITDSSQHHLYPLLASFTTIENKILKSFAFNEVALIRNAAIASQIKIQIDKKTTLEKLIGDGILVSTPTGSTAYNKSCGGSVIPLDSKSLVLTPINSSNPLNWKGTVLKNNHNIHFEILHYKKRSVKIYCDYFKYDISIKDVNIIQDMNTKITILLDKNNNLEDRIIKSQFNQ